MAELRFHVDTSAIEAKLDEILSRLVVLSADLDRVEQRQKQLVQQGRAIVADLTAITAEVSENGDAIASAVNLLSTLSTMIRDLSTDPAALQALADELDSNTNSLAAAIVANTPASPEPTPEPTEPPA